VGPGCGAIERRGVVGGEGRGVHGVREGVLEDLLEVFREDQHTALCHLRMALAFYQRAHV
jgi:hypothetical protein